MRTGSGLTPAGGNMASSSGSSGLPPAGFGPKNSDIDDEEIEITIGEEDESYEEEAKESGDELQFGRAGRQAPVRRSGRGSTSWYMV